MTGAVYANDLALLANTPREISWQVHRPPLKAESDIILCTGKTWTAIDRLSIISKFDLSDEIKREFFQEVAVSRLLYACTSWTLKKRSEKKLNGNYTRVLRAILNKSWKQHPTKKQIYGHLPPISQTIQKRRARYAGHCLRSKDYLICDILL